MGSGQGEGYTVNIPWDYDGMGDDDYIAAFQHVILPIASEYGPDLTIVSAGFDAAAGDPLGTSAAGVLARMTSQSRSCVCTGIRLLRF